RLSVAGDDLASRALLQLLVPGLVRLAGRWTNHHGDRDTGWDVIARAVDYIGRLRERPIRCSPAGYILRSIERDLVRDARIRTHHATGLVQVLDDPHDHDTPHAAPAGTAASAEDDAFARPLLHHAITDAARRGRIPRASAEIIWLEITEGRSLP